MAGPRDYKAGTREALSLLSQGQCYFPGCREPVLRFVEGHPIMNVEVAHIHAAKKGGPFYDPAMSDKERAHFDNLLLLCKPHHTLIDKRQPDPYPPDERRRWKRERDSSLGDLSPSLDSVDSTRLAEMIEATVAANPPRAHVEVEMGCGWFMGNQVARGPVPGIRTVLTVNPHLAGKPLVLTATARNKGQLPVDITSWYFKCRGNRGFELGMAAANHYSTLNPELPARLEVGSESPWLWDMEIVERYVRAAFDAPDPSIFEALVTAQLGTGEKVHSEPVSFEHFPWWSDPDAVAAEVARRRVA